MKLRVTLKLGSGALNCDITTPMRLLSGAPFKLAVASVTEDGNVWIGSPANKPCPVTKGQSLDEQLIRLEDEAGTLAGNLARTLRVDLDLSAPQPPSLPIHAVHSTCARCPGTRTALANLSGLFPARRLMLLCLPRPLTVACM